MPTLQKSERLHGRKAIDSLFAKGEKWAVYPFRIVLETVEDHTEMASVRFLVSVGKRNFKKAVDRNKIKRRIREAYRLHKCRLSDQFSLHSSELKNTNLLLGFIYTAKQIEPYEFLEKRIIRALDEVIEKLKSKFTQQ